MTATFLATHKSIPNTHTGKVEAVLDIIVVVADSIHKLVAVARFALDLSVMSALCY